MEVLIPIAFFAAVIIIIKVVTDRNTEKVKLKIIERAIIENKDNNSFKELFEATHQKKDDNTSIKWGLVLLGFGLALLLSQIIPALYSDKAVFGLMFLFAGIGLTIYHIIFASKNQE